MPSCVHVSQWASTAAVSPGAMSATAMARAAHRTTAPSGGKDSTAWTSPDGHVWSPIAPGYFGAPPASPGVPTLPSFTIADDGSRRDRDHPADAR